MVRDDFAIFILSHGRPNEQHTVEFITTHGYTGKWYIIIDNEDKTAPEYFKLWGDHVVQFDRLAQWNRHDFDIGDNFNANRNSVVFARNMCWDIAKNLGIKWFFEFEDDYYEITRRFDVNGHCHLWYVGDMDSICECFIKYMEEAPNILTVAFSQVGDWLGGMQGDMAKKCVKRKAMNTFMCCTDRPFIFIGRMNDDVNTYVTEGSRGKVFLTVKDLCLRQGETQKAKSGNAAMYLELGTYLKSFYSVMMAPNSVKISMMGQSHRRIHHSIDWEKAVPKIISDKFKKK